MKTIKVQVQLRKDIKESALERAYDQGFSSLEEVIRLLLAQYAAGDIELKLFEGGYNDNFIREAQAHYSYLVSTTPEVK